MTTELNSILKKAIVPCEGEMFFIAEILAELKTTLKKKYNKVRVAGKVLERELRKLGYNTVIVNNKLAIVDYKKRKTETPPVKPTRNRRKSEGERVLEISKRLEKRKFGYTKSLCNVMPEKDYDIINTKVLGEQEAQKRGVRYDDKIRVFAENLACEMAIEQIRALRENQKRKQNIENGD